MDEENEASARQDAEKQERRKLLRVVTNYGGTVNALERRGIGTGEVHTNGKFASGEVHNNGTRITGKGGGPRIAAFGGLTAKQEGFAKDIGYNGKLFIQAYRDNYNAGSMKPAVLSRCAYELAENPLIAKRVDYWSRQKASTASHNPERIRAKIIAGLQAIADDTKETTQNRLKAYEMLGKIDNVGIFKERTVIETNTIQDPEQIKERIQELLKTG